MRQLVYQVCYTRYKVSFYLWWIEPVLKYCNVPKYYDQDCRFEKPNQSADYIYTFKKIDQWQRLLLLSLLLLLLLLLLSRSKSTKEPQEETVKRQKSTIQTPDWHHWQYYVTIILFVFHKRQHSRYFLTLQIKQYLRIITVKQISHSQTKFTYPKSDTKSLYSLQSHPSGSHLLILFFFKSSRLFKFFISIGTIC